MARRIISFDVGIKNLAYCVFSVSTTSPSWEIVSWNCVNLLAFGETPADIRFCKQSIPGKRKSDAPHDCGKHAKWATPDSSTYYCEKHAKMHSDKWQIPRKEHSQSYLNKLKVEPLKQLYVSVGINAEDNTKLPIKKDMIDQLVAHYKRICYVPLNSSAKEKKPGAGEVDLITIGRKIKQCLDSDPEIREDAGEITVLIENQISTIASRMKTIQGMIAQYFIMRFERNANIEFVSSHNKLKGFARDQDEQKSSYKANKSDGIRICSDFFDTNPEGMGKWREAFDKSSKRDDLADCFLQGMTKVRTIYSVADNLKI